MDLTAFLTESERLHGSDAILSYKGKDAAGNPVLVQLLSTDLIFAGLMTENDTEVVEVRTTTFRARKLREQNIAKKVFSPVAGTLSEIDDRLAYIRPYIPYRLADIIAFKRKLNHGQLLRLMIGIVSALEKIDELDGGGHGRLSLDNILLPDLTSGIVFPVDFAEANPKNAAADRRALGWILYQILISRPMNESDMVLALPTDADLSHLGRHAFFWRSFCDRLLTCGSPHQKLPEWKDIRLHLGQPTSAKLQFFRYLIPVAAIVVAVWVVIVWRQHRGPVDSIEVDLVRIESQWHELIEDFFGWGQSFILSIRSFEQEYNDRGFVAQFMDVNQAVLPQSLIRRVTGSGADIHPDRARSINVFTLDDRDQVAIIRAHELLQGTRQAIEQWSVYNSLNEAVRGFQQMGFEFGSTELQQLLDTVSFQNNTLTLHRLYHLQQAESQVSGLQGRFLDFQKAVLQLKNQNQSHFLQHLAEIYPLLLQERVVEPLEGLTLFTQEALELVEFWRDMRPNLALELFQAAEQHLVRTFSFNARLASEQWKFLLQEYQRLDPALISNQRSSIDLLLNRIRDTQNNINDLLDEGARPVDFMDSTEEAIALWRMQASEDLLERDRGRIMKIHEETLSKLQTILEFSELKLMEVNPDIEQLLPALMALAPRFSPILQPFWRQYRREILEPLTVNSFQSPREFLEFQRNWLSTIERFERYEKQYLEALLALADPPPVMELGQFILLFDSVRRNEIAENVTRFAQTTALSVLQNRISDQQLTADFERYHTLISEFTSLISEVLSDLHNYRSALANWDLNSAQDLALRNDFSVGSHPDTLFSHPEVLSVLLQMQTHRNLTTDSNADRNITTALDASVPAPLRFIAMAQLAENRSISVEQVERIYPSLLNIRQLLPSEKHYAFDLIIQDIWTVAFRVDQLTAQERSRVAAIAGTFGISAEMLNGVQRLAFELYLALEGFENDHNNVVKSPDNLRVLSNHLSSLAQAYGSATVVSTMLRLTELDLDRPDQSFQDSSLGKAGWVMTEQHDLLILSRNQISLEFKKFEFQGRTFFVATQQVSVELFNDWMNENRLWLQLSNKIPSEWGDFVNESYNPMEDFREGFRIWRPARAGLIKGGIEISNTWFSPDPFLYDEYRRLEQVVFPSANISQQLPMVQVSPVLALAFAESAGMRLLSPDEWDLVTASYEATAANFWNLALESMFNSSLQRELRGGSVYYELGISAAEPTDVHLTQWLTPVHAGGSQSILKHLAGNAAELLYDQQTNHFFVSGGSVLMAPAAGWQSVIPIPENMISSAFSDLGFRLVADGLALPSWKQFHQLLTAAWHQF